MEKSLRLNKRALCLLLALTAALCAIILYLPCGIRGYLPGSLLVMAIGLFLLTIGIKKRPPAARELLLMSVFCGLAVAGRAAFFMLPQVKPMLAITILAGVCMGQNAGFLVGAMSAFVSNFLFGQGPWTPWQMLGAGLCGYLAGLLFRKKSAPKTLVLCTFGAFAALIIYGPLLNFSSMLTITAQTPGFDAFLATELAGLPFDAMHAAATAVFLLLLSKPILEKIERVKLKYGLFE
ncbi:MAG: ECF transporter S component [Clostridium sp.]|nr:ECF transporter S component [Clostridium sp.]